MIHLKATSKGFHLTNGADLHLPPYLLLYSAANATGRMISEDGETWHWDLPTGNAPYAIKAISTDDGDQREITKIEFYRQDDDAVLIGQMDLKTPILVDVTPPAQTGEPWETDIALPFRMAVKDQALMVSGHAGDDRIDLNDPLMALHEPMKVHAAKGNDHVTGGLGDDHIQGGRGDDVITDTKGNNLLEGGKGNDRIETSDPYGSSKLKGGDGNDMLISGAGDDVLRGGDGKDVLKAGSGNDSLLGGRGDDHLISGLGDDWMKGGRGSDLFEVNVGLTGEKTIKDFSVDHDILFLLNFNGTLDDLSFEQSGSDAVLVDAGIGFKLTLKNTDIDDLMIADIQIG